MAMKSAYATSAKIFSQVTQRHNPDLAEHLKAIKKGEIVVVEGDHDHIEVLLDQMKIPYDLIQSEDIEGQQGHRVMFVNCREYEKSEVPKKAAQGFVDSGGRIVTTDWALSFAAAAFPGKLYRTDETEDDVVEVRPQTYLARSMIGLNYTQCRPKWWLEGASHVYRTGKDVIDLITSEEMRQKYGQNHVAVAFQHGKGEVFHFISHLELQRTNQRTEADKGTIDDFLKKMKASRTKGMDDANVAELEVAYSTLNTLAYLCSARPLLSPENFDGKSYMPRAGGAKASKALV